MHFHHVIFTYKFTPVLEYGLVTPDEEKHRQGFISHQKVSVTQQTKNKFITNPSKSLLHKLQT